MENKQVSKLCKIRDIYRSIYEFENSFQSKHNLSLNEGMLLCTLNESEHTSTELANILGLTPSNTSKVIRLVETKGFIERKMGVIDKRLMHFKLTEFGRDKILEVKSDEMEIPELLKELF